MLTTKLEAAQARIRERWYPGFTWVVNDAAPWAPLAKPLAEATVALLSTCGLYRADVHVPFDAWNDLGDPSFRAIRDDTPPERLRIAHAHYEHQHVAADHEVSLPVIHLHRLAQEGRIGACHPWLYSFTGFLPEPRQLIAETAPEVARYLRADGVDAALLTPC
jgi:hypothetical protein